MSKLKKLQKEQAGIIGLYTGVVCGPFEDIHSLAEKLLGRPVFTHEFACRDTIEQLKELAKPLFLELCCE